MSTQFEPHTLTAGPIKLSLLPYGLTFHSLIVKVSESDERDLLIGYSDPADHHFEASGARGFRNQTVGRYANRLPSGKTNHEGIELDLPTNEGTSVTLHGGIRGIDTKEWTLVDRSSSTLFPTNDSKFPSIPVSEGEEAIYRLISESGEDGFPLKLEIEGLVIVSKAGSNAENSSSREGSLGKVIVVLRARIIDADDSISATKFGTPLNLTVHWGFNLDNDGSDCRGHKLFIDSSKVTALDSKMLATGKLDSTKQGDALNFEQGIVSEINSHRTIGSNFLENGLDHNIVFNSVDTLKPKVVLTSTDSKVTLEFTTNQSTVQAYTAAGFDGTQSRKTHHQSTKENGYEKFAAAFLEFHHPIATFLHEELIKVAGTDTILKVGEIYENLVEIEILARV